MDELIRVVDGQAQLNETVSQKIAAFERQIKDMKAQEEDLKAQILAAMEAGGILWIDTPEIKITYIAPTDRESLDSKGLKAEHPDLYDEYVRFVPVRSSVRIKVK